MKTICVIPYFGGFSPVAYSFRNKRPGYLLKTLENQRADEIYLIVCNADDKKLVESFGNVIEVECNPVFLPAIGMSKVADLEFDVIYYTEADQILYCNDDFWDQSIKRVNEDKDCFVIPRRFFRTIHSDLGRGGNKEKLTLQAHSVDTAEKSVLGRFYIETDPFRAFGGAWLTSSEFFDRILFSQSEHMPVEHTSCFDLFNVPNSKPLLSVDPFDFWVDHLSALDHVNSVEQKFKKIPYV